MTISNISSPAPLHRVKDVIQEVATATVNSATEFAGSSIQGLRAVTSSLKDTAFTVAHTGVTALARHHRDFEHAGLAALGATTVATAAASAVAFEAAITPVICDILADAVSSYVGRPLTEDMREQIRTLGLQLGCTAGGALAAMATLHAGGYSLRNIGQQTLDIADAVGPNDVQTLAGPMASS